MEPGKAKILIVDDEVSICDILSRLMKGEGFDALIAHDGETGLKILREQRPDVMFLDFMMPFAIIVKPGNLLLYPGEGCLFVPGIVFPGQSFLNQGQRFSCLIQPALCLCDILHLPFVDTDPALQISPFPAQSHLKPGGVFFQQIKPCFASEQIGLLYFERKGFRILLGGVFCSDQLDALLDLSTL